MTPVRAQAPHHSRPEAARSSRKNCVSTSATVHTRVPAAAIGVIRIRTASAAGSSGVFFTRW